VLVTGAGRGSGRAIAARFARDGFAVALVGRGAAALTDVAGELASATEAFPLACDVTDRDAVRRAVAQVEQRLGPIDVLVNNAGESASAPFASMDDGLWDRMLGINLTGTYNCMRAVVPSMFERRQGRVINIASVAARIGFAYTAAYVASKHGVLGLTRAVAIEAATRGVTVNAICPGWMNTDMTIRSIERIVEKTGRSLEEARRTLERMNPQQRLIEPEEVAAIAAFLASPEAAGINGQDITI
jgi:NAD(P)-dependent dehydrogenase (short-subunit alcohol dehydrogenase family)